MEKVVAFIRKYYYWLFAPTALSSIFFLIAWKFKVPGAEGLHAITMMLAIVLISIKRFNGLTLRDTSND